MSKIILRPVEQILEQFEIWKKIEKIKKIDILISKFF